MSRKLAFLLLRAILRIAPASVREWGKAMVSEMEFVEGSISTLRWSVGCAWVLVQATCKDVIARRTMLAISVVSVVIVFLLFLVPGFRQVSRASFVSWQLNLFKSRGSEALWPDSALQRIAVQAEERRDGKALAFVATRLVEGAASARAADRAVELEPDLAWVYYIVAIKHPFLPDVPGWAAKLAEWAPQNAASFLVTLPSLDLERMEPAPVPGGFVRRPRTDAWQRMMTSAVQAPQFDDYLRQQLEVDRGVVTRYGLWDPLLFISGYPDRRIPRRGLNLPPSRIVRPDPDDGALVRHLRQHPIDGAWRRPAMVSIRTVQVASLLIPAFAVLLVIGAVVRRRLLTMRLVGSLGLVASAITLCIVYLPYAQTFSTFIAEGEVSQLESLRAFYSYSFLPLGGRNVFLVQSCWWAGVILLSFSWLVHFGSWLRIRFSSSLH